MTLITNFRKYFFSLLFRLTRFYQQDKTVIIMKLDWKLLTSGKILAEFPFRLHVAVMCSGGRYTGGRQHHRASDVTAAVAGLSMHPVLCVQTLPGQEEHQKEEEER